MINEPKAYRVINRQMVESLARSMGMPIGQAMSSETEFGASKIISARSKRTRTSPPLSSSDPVLIPEIVERLRNAGVLHHERPLTAGEYWRSDSSAYYVWEDAVLTPVHLQLRGRIPDHLEGPDSINVWVGDPPTRPESSDAWDFSTCFLFLVEELGAFEWPSSWFFSGISSLRLVAEFIGRGRSDPQAAIDELGRSGDNFGRFNPEHPIRKLETIGGVVGSPRRIETVYKVAYATDEQADSRHGPARRVSDLLGYPLYIA